METYKLMDQIRMKRIKEYIFKNPGASNSEIAAEFKINKAFFSSRYAKAANDARKAYLDGDLL